jgi:hypothetical protein
MYSPQIRDLSPLLFPLRNSRTVAQCRQSCDDLRGGHSLAGSVVQGYGLVIPLDSWAYLLLQLNSHLTAWFTFMLHLTTRTPMLFRLGCRVRQRLRERLGVRTGVAEARVRNRTVHTINPVLLTLIRGNPISVVEKPARCYKRKRYWHDYLGCAAKQLQESRWWWVVPAGIVERLGVAMHVGIQIEPVVHCARAAELPSRRVIVAGAVVIQSACRVGALARWPVKAMVVGELPLL